MSDFMKTDMRQPMLFQKVVKTMADIVRRIRVSIVPFEHIRILRIIRAKQAPVFDFFPFGFCKNCSGFRGQWKRTSARSILRLVLFHYRSDFHDRMTDSQCSAFFVNAVPLQTEQFTSAQSVNRCDFDKRQQRVICSMANSVCICVAL